MFDLTYFADVKPAEKSGKSYKNYPGSAYCGKYNSLSRDLDTNMDNHYYLNTPKKKKSKKKKSKKFKYTYNDNTIIENFQNENSIICNMIKQYSLNVILLSLIILFFISIFIWIKKSPTQGRKDKLDSIRYSIKHNITKMIQMIIS